MLLFCAGEVPSLGDLSACMGTSFLSLSRSTKGGHCGHSVAPGLLDGTQARDILPGASPVEGVPPSRPSLAHHPLLSRFSCVFRPTPRVSRVLPVRIGAGVYSGAVRTSQSFGRHPSPPLSSFILISFSLLYSLFLSLLRWSHMQTESYIVRQHNNIIWEHFTCKTCLKILWKGLVKIITHSKG